MLKKQEIHTNYMKDMYKGASRSKELVIEEDSVKMGLHQGSTLSLVLGDG